MLKGSPSSECQEITWHDKQGTAHLLWKLGADVPSLKMLVGVA